ncbi:DUF5979 domain-containing protein [Salininema proteolyticum]|uniref:DUF5979 domain-containing protein n=1 Tax=Salininema proteolyticum TaxID=1607685 RepID=A0ABV8U0Z7_9ACTN
MQTKWVSRWIGGSSLAAALAAGLFLVPTAALAMEPPKTGPSDERADYLEGNIRDCEHGGYPAEDGYVQLAAQNTGTADDGLVRVTGGTVPSPPPDGHLPSSGEYTGINVEILPDGVDMNVVVDAVFVKASTDTNRYTSPHVPPELGPDQWYIGPMITSGKEPKVADVSHYIVCYRFKEQHPPPTSGSLGVAKQVISPDGAAGLPDSYEATVECDTSGTFNVTFGSAGGLGDVEGAGKVIEDLVPGETCTVTETDPPGAVVSYVPSQEVTIEGGKDILVNIVNDFTDMGPMTGRLEIVKETDDGTSGDSFIVQYSCQGSDSPTSGAVEVASGESAAVESIPSGMFCEVAELPEDMPHGWEIAGYDVTGAEELVYSEDGNPIFRVDADSTVTVTVKNAALPTLSVTGGSLWIGAAIAAAILAAGGIAMAFAKLRRKIA